MSNFKELTNLENKFEFRGKIYKFLAYCPIHSIEMKSEDGEKFSFGVDSPVSKEFKLLKPGAIVLQDKITRGTTEKLFGTKVSPPGVHFCFHCRRSQKYCACLANIKQKILYHLSGEFRITFEDLEKIERYVVRQNETIINLRRENLRKTFFGFIKSVFK